MNIDLLFSNFELFNTPEKIQNLKEAILQLAIQGKLILQDPSDEPASKLLKRIKAEKEKLIKEGKLKNEKPLPPISQDEIPYELPRGWEWMRLGEVTNIILGQSPPSSTYSKEAKGLPFYQGKADFGVLYPTPSTWCTSPNKLAISGDILISVRAPVGPTNLCSENSCIGRGLSAIRMILDNSNFYFLYFLRSIEDKLSGKGFGTTFNAITGKDLNILLTPVPPISEQKRIVEKVEELFSKADEIESKLKKADDEIVHLNKSAMNQLLESKDEEDFRNNFEFIVENFDLLYSDERNVKELRQAILQLAVQGKLVPQDPNDKPPSELIKEIKAEKAKLIKEGKLKKEKSLRPISEDEIPYQLPTGWQWVRLGEVTNFGITYKVDKELLNDKTWILYLEDIEKISSQLLRKARYSERKFKSSSNQFQIGDVLYGKLRPYLDKVVVADEPGICSGEILPIRSHFGIDSSYLRLTLKRPDFIDYVNDKIYGTKMPRLGTNDGKMALIPLAPTNEQKGIVEKVDQLMALCDELESKIVKSKEESERLIGAILQ